MPESTCAGAYYDPFDVSIDNDPYPVWQRLRDESPLYYNDKYGFYALSRFTDVAASLQDWNTFRSSRGTILEVLLSGQEIPSGLVLWEDPPLHDLHRKLLSRVFTPRRMATVEPLVRRFTIEALDQLIGEDRFDFIENLGAWIPMRTIGALLGIPEGDQATLRDNTNRHLSLKGEGEMRTGVSAKAQAEDEVYRLANLDFIAEYVDWRTKNPSDDLMTDLINFEVEELDGTKRLTRTEILTYVATIVGAGSETATRLIGFAGQLLSDHPDQRRQLVADRSLIPHAIEEILRFEAPSPVQGRYVAQDTTYYGQNVAAGSVMMLINGSANRDERRYENPDRFDIQRRAGHLSFGQGLHFCLGAALARMEGSVALEEVLKRWPDWEIDYTHAERARTTSVRGWSRLPAIVRRLGR